MISHSELLRTLDYNPLTGIVTWKIKPGNNVSVGHRAGTVCKARTKKYRSIRIKGTVKREHCWIWYYMTGKYPTQEIDHRNGNGLDNKWVNLRHVSSSVNRHNHRKFKDNKSGITGVFWDSRKKAWCVTFSINKSQKRICQTKDFFEACCVRKSLEHKHGYSKQHGSLRPY